MEPAIDVAVDRLPGPSLLNDAQDWLTLRQGRRQIFLELFLGCIFAVEHEAQIRGEVCSQCLLPLLNGLFNLLRFLGGSACTSILQSKNGHTHQAQA